MITITRQTDPAVIDDIKYNFVEDCGYDQQACADFIQNLMRRSDADKVVCVITASQGTLYSGHLIGYLTMYGRVVIEQAYNTSGPEISRDAMALLEDWARGIGASELRLETSEPRVVVYAKDTYGFSEHSYIMRKEL